MLTAPYAFYCLGSASGGAMRQMQVSVWYIAALTAKNYRLNRNTKPFQSR